MNNKKILGEIPWLDKKKKELFKSLKGSVSTPVDLNNMREYFKYGEEKEEHVLLNTVKNLDLYLHPIELKLRDRYLQIVQKHGNGLWALEELVWEVYDKHIDEYEALNEEDKFVLNMYMKVLRSLYK